MTLTNSEAMRQIIGCLMLNPLLLLEYPDINPSDFDEEIPRICFMAIHRLYTAGAKTLTVIEVDQEITHVSGSLAAKKYQDGNGLDFLKWAYENVSPGNFKLYYDRLKKYSLLRRLRKDKYDISEYYIDDKYVINPLQEAEIKQHLEEATLETILNSVESKYSVIRNDFLNGGRMRGDPAEGINDLIEKLKTTPSIGPDLEGDIFSTCCRGARTGCFFLKSASTSAGKTRTAVFDACRIAYPKRWSEDLHSFITETDRVTKLPRPARKVLFIVTEMDKEELQTIMLAYLSGVDEDHIIRGDYSAPGEELRVKYAAKIMQDYSGYFIIEEISEPDLNNVQSTIKKYAIVDDVKYVFFDYIHTTANLVAQFSKSHLREDVVLMLLANELKQLAKDYNLFIFSATQVNAIAMGDEGEFKNEMSIRGSKAVADKADVGFVMTKVNDKLWNSIASKVQAAVNAGDLDGSILVGGRPTHVLDIYKMRRGRYKNVRVWTSLHLGTGYRKDLFISTADNTPLKTTFFTTSSFDFVPFDFEKEK